MECCNQFDFNLDIFRKYINTCSSDKPEKRSDRMCREISCHKIECCVYQNMIVSVAVGTVFGVLKLLVYTSSEISTSYHTTC